MLSIPAPLICGMLSWSRVQCLWSSGTYHSKPCIMVIFSGVGFCSALVRIDPEAITRGGKPEPAILSACYLVYGAWLFNLLYLRVFKTCKD